MLFRRSLTLLLKLLFFVVIVSCAVNAKAEDIFSGKWQRTDGKMFDIVSKGVDKYYHSGLEKECVSRGHLLECLWPFGPTDWREDKPHPPESVKRQVEGKAMIGMILKFSEDSSAFTIESVDLDVSWNDRGQITNWEIKHTQDNDPRVRVACPELVQLKEQLNRDQEAMRRLQASMKMGNTELEDWKTANEKAQVSALKTAFNMLQSSLISVVGKSNEGNLKELENVFRARTPSGITLQARLEQVRKYRLAKARLSGSLDGIAISELKETATDASVAFERLSLWAKSAEPDAKTIDGIIRDWNSKSEVRAILDESGFSAIVGGVSLVKSLDPWMKGASFAKFVVDYGYDATAWTLSRNRIVQQNNLRDKELKAVDALTKQIERTVSRIQKCRGLR